MAPPDTLITNRAEPSGVNLPSPLSARGHIAGQTRAFAVPIVATKKIGLGRSGRPVQPQRAWVTLFEFSELKEMQIMQRKPVMAEKYNA